MNPLLLIGGGALALFMLSRRGKKNGNGGQDPAPDQAKDIEVEGLDMIGDEYNLSSEDRLIVILDEPYGQSWEIYTESPTGTESIILEEEILEPEGGAPEGPGAVFEHVFTITAADPGKVLARFVLVNAQGQVVSDEEGPLEANTTINVA